MDKHNSKVTEYIAKSEDFAKPILNHWRQLIFATCPEAVETIKWGIPHFEYKDDNMCVMASFKNHCSFTFLKAELMKDPKLKDSKSLKPIQRFMGKITKTGDLPADKEFVSMLKEAMKLNEQGVKVPVEKKKSDKPQVLETPAYFVAQLTSNPKAKEVFESKSNSFRKEYIVWIDAAKTDETREKRMKEAIEWIAEGKSRFWQFKK